MSDVLAHLEEEHRKVEGLLSQLKDTEPGDERKRLVGELEESLSTHMAVEERFIYPLIAEALDEEDAEDAEDEHQLTRDGLAALKGRVEEGAFEAALEILEHGISHHVEEEEQELFPKLRERAGDQLAGLDPEELEQQVKGSGSDGPTRDELYEEAKEAGVEGRSTMTKDELADALDK